MKNMIAAVVAGGAVLVAAAPAHAAPKDPVRALQAQLVTGHGVRFSETTTLADDRGKDPFQRRTGTFQFNKKGIAASDITAKMLNETSEFEDSRTPERTISVGRTGWSSGGMWKDQLPEGKTWYKIGGMLAGGSGFYGQVINPAEPKTLAGLIKKGKHVRNTYTGKITFKELDKLSPWFGASIPIRWHNETKVSYTLTVNGAGLVTRVTSSYAATGVFDTDALEGKTFTIDSRFTGWGRKVSIKAPDPDKVATKLNE
ncbi:hypothetical protein ACFLIM_11160 [Nonomuraea sp. M3C6]|uniref:Lipoprotein n=1 Tax=Nonomuraea marmarensis TaxID=3351344 RepID=A0ABW7A8V3_9ACTN